MLPHQFNYLKLTHFQTPHHSQHLHTLDQLYRIQTCGDCAGGRKKVKNTAWREEVEGAIGEAERKEQIEFDPTP